MMTGEWYDSGAWDDTEERPTAEDGTHTCRVCDHAATIQTPQRRTEHYCTECDAWRRFVSTLEGARGP